MLRDRAPTRLVLLTNCVPFILFAGMHSPWIRSVGVFVEIVQR